MTCSSRLNLDKVNKILICQLRQIGDVLLATPAIELLRKRFPNAELHVFTEKKCTPMLAHNPNITQIWAVDKKKLDSLFKEIAFYWQVARQNFDLVVDFQKLPRCRWVVGFSRASIRLAPTAPWYTSWLYTCTHPLRTDVYAAHQKASLLEALGIEWKGELPRLYLTEEEHAIAASILEESGLKPEQKLVSLDPTHRRITRRWPLEHFAKLIDLAYEHDSLIRFLPLYGPGEKEEVEELANMVKHKEAVLITPRMLSLREAAACQARAVLHFGNCSAPRHIATAVGTPTLTILGATDKSWDYPSPKHSNISLGLPCQPCNKNECSLGIVCLKDLLPEQVLPDFIRMIDKGAEYTCNGDNNAKLS